MCFPIDTTAKRPLKRTVYKVVEQGRSGYLQSPIHANLSGGRSWYPGVVVRRSKGPTTDSAGDAYHGIYVFLSRAAAVDQAIIWGRSEHFVLDVAVDPKDWLHTSSDGHRATYDKVTVKEKQREIEWYE